MEIISSRNNKYIVELAKLKDKKYREKERKFLIEGEHLIQEAYKTNNLETVLYSDIKYRLEGVNNIEVSDSVIEKLAFSKTPQKVIGVCNYLKQDEQETKTALLLDNVQDPGNVGALIRSSLGFNVDKVYLSEDSVDLYNDKLIRASQGAIFHLNLEVGNLELIIKELKKKEFKIFGTSVKEGVSLNELKRPSKVAIILGNEGSGIKEEILKLTDSNIYIKTNDFLESLNVSVAGSIILYHLDLKVL